MMQQTMEASHTDSIQVQSWTLGLKQVNPSCGHTFNFFFLLSVSETGLLFQWDKAGSICKSNSAQLKKTIGETSPLKGWGIILLSIVYYLYLNTFVSQHKRRESEACMWVIYFSPKLNTSVLPGTFWLLYLCYQVVCISSSLWCPDLQRDSNKGNTKWHSN